MSMLADEKPEVMHDGRSNASEAISPAGRVIKALVAKELRQNFSYLGLAICAALIAVCIAEWFRSHFLIEPLSSYWSILLAPVIRNAVPLWSAVAASLIGVLQPLSDRSFDAWTFLYFRPVTIRMQFAARVIAGTIHFAIAVLLPVGIMLLFALSPLGGRFLLWRYTLPVVADVLAGYSYYWAGLLIMDRHARIYGSRLVPLLMALGVSYVSMTTGRFLVAAGYSLAAILLLAAAVYGSMASHGYRLKTAGSLAKCALAVTMILSFTLPLVLFTSKRLHALLKPQGHAFATADTTESTQAYTYRADGQFAISTFTGVRQQGRSRETGTSTVDLHGHALGRILPINETRRLIFSTFISRPLRRPAMAHSFRDLQAMAQERDFPGSDAHHVTAWYWIPRERLFRIYEQPREADEFGQYHLSNGPLLGAIGQNGFHTQPVEAVPFDLLESIEDDILTPDALYRVDRTAKTLIVLFHAAPDEALLHFDEPGRDSSDGATSKSETAIFTTKRFIHFDAMDQTPLILPMPAPIGPDDEVAVERLGKVLALRHTVYARDETRRESEWTVYSEDGKTIQTGPLHADHVRWNVVSTSLTAADFARFRWNDALAGAWISFGNPLAVFPMHAFFSPTSPSIPDKAIETNEPLAKEDTVAQRMMITREAAIGLLAASIVCALLTWLLACMYHAHAKWMWGLAAFLTGPAAVLALLATHSLPRRIRCPSCGKNRPLSENRCPRCENAFPSAPTNGTEIFIEPQAAFPF